MNLPKTREELYGAYYLKNDCIKCWNYKKEKIGKHKYEKEDLKNIKVIRSCKLSCSGDFLKWENVKKR